MAAYTKLYKKHMIGLAVSLGGIILLFGIYFLSVLAFNKTDRHFSLSEESSEVSLNMYPRGGITDCWKKTVHLDEDKDGDGENDVIYYYAAIYEAKLTNKTKHTISDWLLKINFDRDCWINSAWCGTIDFYQNTENGVKHQLVDLRDYNIGDIELDYLLYESDILIPVKKGEYIIYNPTEYPIEPSDVKKDELQSVVIGFIIYNNTDELMEFPSVEIFYHLEKKMNQDLIFWFIVALFIFWTILVIVFISVELNILSLRRRNEQNEKIIEQSLSVFTKFVDAKDAYTNGHSHRVAEYSAKIAKAMGLSEDECRSIYYIALMHDSGKVYVPDDILKKNGKLTDEEYNIIKAHTVKGAEMLKDFTSITEIRDGALYHHERYDGRGYPSGKEGENIPFIGRIICVADSFDAMNSKRCYRDHLSREAIMSELKTNRGKQFDPKIVDCLIKLLEEGKISFDEVN